MFTIFEFCLFSNAIVIFISLNKQTNKQGTLMPTNSLYGPPRLGSAYIAFTHIIQIAHFQTTVGFIESHLNIPRNGIYKKNQFNCFLIRFPERFPINMINSIII